jgi:hypothetical protein
MIIEGARLNTVIITIICNIREEASPPADRSKLKFSAIEIFINEEYCAF